MSAAKVVASVTYTTSNVCGGTVGLSGATTLVCDASPIRGVATTQFVDCASNNLIAAAVVAGTVTIVNSLPTIDPINDSTLHWGTSYIGDANGSDADAGGCEKLTYSKVVGPAAMTVNSTTGAISWFATGANVCLNPVTISVTDSCGASAQTSFTICVFNDAPVMAACPNEPTMLWGGLASGGVSASDVDGGPAPLEYSLVSFSGPGTVNINPITGEWSWQTLEANAYIGTFSLCIKASDGAAVCSPCSPANADTCCFSISVIPTFAITIEKTHNTSFGQIEDVHITLNNSVTPGNPMGGYDLLIDYDASVLSLSSVDPGDLILDCGWEYFTYRLGVSGNCGSNACPSGKVRIVAIAETNNGNNHPACFGATPAANSDLAVLHFLVTNDYTKECQYVPIRFMWYDCGDNAISSKTGDTLFISRHVVDYSTGDDLANPSASFPTYYGANSSCDTLIGDGKPDPVRAIDFYNGGIDIVCVDSIDDRGDINLNGLSNEIADAVLFSNYFVYGIGVFTINVAGQVAATDVNADGTTLSVADLVFLIRVVVGDASPIPKTVLNPAAVAIESIVNIDANYNLSIQDLQIGAAAIVLRGDVRPTLAAGLVGNMLFEYHYDATSNVTRAIVFSPMEDVTDIHSFTGDFINTTGAEIVSIEMATFEGQPVALDVLPTVFSLDQNYPNPFNPKTRISFSLPTKSDYTLTIYNVNGQEVSSFNGS
ncbi:MAG: putative Ig domain-containing protein, partial [Gallionella sp.]